MSSGDDSRPVLVCGGAGYIGSHTVRHLAALGLPVVVLDNLSTGHRAAVGAAVGVPLEVVELADRDRLGEVFQRHRPRAVVHFAARCYVGESVEHPARYYRENVLCTWNLLEAMRASDTRQIVFSSTCATYGNPVRLPLTEDHPQQPISPYGRTKLHIEHMLADYADAYGFSIAALRYFNAAGAAQDGSLGEDHAPETHLIPLVLQVAQGRRPALTVFGADYPTPDGTCVRDYVHVEDLARAHAAALAALAAGERRIFVNLGTGSGYSVREVLAAARRVTGHAIPEVLAARRAGDPPELVSGGSRAREVLGWRAERSALELILGDAWRFHQKHPRGYAS